jgi:hypothetical protein
MIASAIAICFGPTRGKKKLARIPGGPIEGLIVTIYMIGEIEMEATLLRWSAKYKAWIARPIEGGMVRDNTESWDDHA